MAEAKNIPPTTAKNVTHRQPKGFIVFCEKNLRYEGGRKAWLFFGPYLFGAYVLYATILEKPGDSQKGLMPWLGFIVYLVLFPSIWKWINRLSSKRDPGRNAVLRGTSETDERNKSSKSQ